MIRWLIFWALEIGKEDEIPICPRGILVNWAVKGTVHAPEAFLLRPIFELPLVGKTLQA